MGFFYNIYSQESHTSQKSQFRHCRGETNDSKRAPNYYEHSDICGIIFSFLNLPFFFASGIRFALASTTHVLV